MATDEFLDLALVKVETTFPKAVRWGNSANLKPGDALLVVGFPFDLAKFASQGIVSAVGFERKYPVIVTDAVVNPGNSGCGVFDVRGELVGMARSTFGPGPGRGSGFAIPGNTARLFVIRNLP